MPVSYSVNFLPFKRTEEDLLQSFIEPSEFSATYFSNSKIYFNIIFQHIIRYPKYDILLSVLCVIQTVFCTVKLLHSYETHTFRYVEQYQCPYVVYICSQQAKLALDCACQQYLLASYNICVHQIIKIAVPQPVLNHLKHAQNVYFVKVKLEYK
jgi:hypothetical protein